MRILINPIGGLANRMRAMASGIALCRDLSIIPEIIWPINSELNCKYEKLFNIIPDAYKLKNVSGMCDLFFYDEPRKKNIYLSKIFRKRKNIDLFISDKDISGKYIDDTKRLIDDIRTTKGDVIIRSGLEFYNFDDTLYLNLFKPTEHVSNIVGQIIQEFDNHKTIGLHIRRTDNIIAIQQSPLYLFKNVIDEEIKNNNDIKFYLATDSESVKQEMKNLYGNRIITSSHQVSRKTESGIIEALTEMLVLSKCDKIYGSYWSSFSEAAALLGNTHLIQLVK